MRELHVSGDLGDCPRDSGIVDFEQEAKEPSRSLRLYKLSWAGAGLVSLAPAVV
jgi:hypothetical protein